MSNRKRNKGGREYRFSQPELGFAHREHRSKKGRKIRRETTSKRYKRRKEKLKHKDKEL